MFCSTIIPTIGRPTLNRAVHSVLEQDFNADDFEVIVVNDSGQPLPEADWHKSGRVQIIDTNRRERCVSRNLGAAVAKGRYLHFLDDDDWLLPGALYTFHQITDKSHASWVYGGTQLVDREGKPLIRLKHRLSGNCFIQMVAGEWIPLQTSLIQAKAFFDIGGFNPIIAGIEDIDLNRRLALRYDITGTDTIVGCVGMGRENSTTNKAQTQQDSRWAREALLNETGVFSRMRLSAHSGYWCGRIVRAYLTSMIWNLRRRNFSRATSRAIFGATGIFLASQHLISISFWQAISTSYHSKTFEAGFREASLSSAQVS